MEWENKPVSDGAKKWYDKRMEEWVMADGIEGRCNNRTTEWSGELQSVEWKIGNRVKKWCSNIKKWCSNIKKWCSNIKKWCSSIKKWCSNIKKWCSNIKKWCSNIKKWCSNIKKWCTNIKKWCSNIKVEWGKEWKKTVWAMELSDVITTRRSEVMQNGETK